MKRTLLATTALAAIGAVAAAQPAAAAEKIKISVGGYMEQWFGYVSQDTNRATRAAGGAAGNANNGFDQKSDSEIYFTGKTKLDNGIEFGLVVELEANTSADMIDESFAYIQGSFGRVLIGSENSAAYLMHYGLPSAGLGMTSGDQSQWFGQTTGVANYTWWNNVSRGPENDAQKVTYFTPRIEGFQGGVSYTPEYREDESGLVPGTGGVYRNGMSFGLNFMRKFGDVDLRVSGGHTRADAPANDGSPDLRLWHAGAQVGFAGFRVAGIFGDGEGTSAAIPTPGGARIDGQIWGAGVGYTQGPASITLNWMGGDAEGIPGNGRKSKKDQYELGVGYVLGPGVAAKGSIFHEDAKGEGVTNNDDNKGWAMVGGIRLDF